MTGIFRDDNAVPVLDTVTGIEYESKGAAGRALAASFGLNPIDRFIWYTIHYAAPQRFVDPTTHIVIPLENTKG
jgi:hypothetical protein